MAAWRDFGRGGRAVVDSALAIARERSLWRWTLAPIAAVIVAWLAIATPGLWLVARLSLAAVGNAGVLAAVGRALFDLFFGLVVIFVALLAAIAIAQPVARTSLDRLVATLAPPSPNAPRKQPASSLSRSLVVASIGALTSLTAVGLLEVITVFLPEGFVFTEPLALIAGALAITWDLFDHPLSRRGLTMRERVAWLWANKWLVLGFAVATEALVFVPVVDLLVLPIGVVAASRLVLASEEEAAPKRLE
ncbi:MAG: EI24 domain-containing protein [Polyangiales bacterium]